MKKIFFSLVAVAALFLQSCEGPMGPMGPNGPQGPQGPQGPGGGSSGTILSQVHEVEVPIFDAKNEYRVYYDFTKPIYATDKIIGFIWVGQDKNKNDIWEPMPQTFFVKGNTFLYSFDFTKNDFSIFLDGNADLSLVPVAQRSNKIFRIVVVPAEFAKVVNTMSYDDVIQKLNIKNSDFVQGKIDIVQ